MATYPPRRLLGARPLPSDPRRDPRRSDFPRGGGGRWERRLPTGQSWGWVDRFPRVRDGLGRSASLPHLPPRGLHRVSHRLAGSPRNLRCLFTHFQRLAAHHHHLLKRKFKEQQHYVLPSLFLPLPPTVPSCLFSFLFYYLECFCGPVFKFTDSFFRIARAVSAAYNQRLTSDSRYQET
ncbi:uncharacterized protein [Tursiops truncatus]|uniref:uncharacterized protein n=1 Tax=Tursiops truncatus TaxID=9739 RepID=UPI003CCF2F7F